MMQSLSILLTFLVATNVSGFAPSRLSTINFRRGSSPARLAVGDSVIAEVDDIRGSVSDPMVSFLVRLMHGIFFHTCNSWVHFLHEMMEK